MSYGVARVLAVLLWTMALLVASFPSYIMQHRRARPVIFRRIPHVIDAYYMPADSPVAQPAIVVRKRSQPTDTEYTDEFSVDPFMIYS
ncbi:hypothetical protein QR680_001104 [Steinernema hermaphroditum]|uniref:Uncharacterized protein n=1 Tax=Steinernema hermaphroditum TaxID=289476 RepID=A0AA39GWY9_9BILA|nr:hypothetical protein QR680_001104 [Steinernema hermaphroditum]